MDKEKVLKKVVKSAVKADKDKKVVSIYVEDEQVYPPEKE